MMANVPRLYHIHWSSGANIIAAIGHLEVKKSLHLGSAPDPAGGAYSTPQTPAGGQGLATPSLRTPPSLGLSGLGLPFALPWKNPVGAHDVVRQFPKVL